MPAKTTGPLMPTGDKEGAGMMQHEMGPAMHKEHVQQA